MPSSLLFATSIHISIQIQQEPHQSQIKLLKKGNEIFAIEVLHGSHIDGRTMKIICIRKNTCSHGKKNLLFLPSNMPAVQNLYREAKIFFWGGGANVPISPHSWQNLQFLMFQFSLSLQSINVFSQ